VALRPCNPDDAHCRAWISRSLYSAINNDRGITSISFAQLLTKIGFRS
jgi:hypothetical protein